jgi:uncharacterized membrane protein YgdD (TMEM256/DUF423 family)
MNSPFFNRLQVVAAVTGAVGVIFGAFGAHFLKARLAEGNLETIKTGVLYLFIHTLATLLVCALSKNNPSRALKGAGLSFMIGIGMFSGSLFIIGTASLTGFPVSTIGFITPLGGLSFILGWIFLIFSAARQ